VEPRDFGVWDEVPPGAWLFLRLETEGAVVARGAATRSAAGVGVEETPLPHVRLAEGARVLCLEEGMSGVVVVTLHFPAGWSSAALEATVLDPAGRPFKSRYRYRTEGARGDTFRATLLLTGERLDLEHGATE
jgi:hypothetical protein